MFRFHQHHLQTWMFPKNEADIWLAVCWEEEVLVSSSRGLVSHPHPPTHTQPQIETGHKLSHGKKNTGGYTQTHTHTHTHTHTTWKYKTDRDKTPTLRPAEPLWPRERPGLPVRVPLCVCVPRYVYTDHFVKLAGSAEEEWRGSALKHTKPHQE